MQASIIIPVWNGASVVIDCLEALYTHSGSELLEVICVDNDSSDESVVRITEAYPQVRLIHEPVNLGFAGGVNAGMEAAQGDIFILLNQDCIVRPGWLKAFLQALEVYPQYGIVGCTIYNADGTLNHTGARVRHPDAVGEHLTDLGDGQVRPVEFVTGAAVAIRRQVWEVVGRFDEGYYPAYYEDSDYCYRARHKGFETAWVPQAQVRHLFSSRAWQTDPIKHTTSGYTSRYRFVCKHFSDREMGAFFEAESAALENVRYLDHALGRVIAARDTLRSLPDILERRRLDLDEVLSISGQRQLRVGFTQVFRQALEMARQLALSEFATPGPDKDLQRSIASTFDQWGASARRLQELRQREEALFTLLYPRSPHDLQPKSVIRRLNQLLFKPLTNWLLGHDHALLSELNAVHIEHMATLERRIEQAAEIDQWHYRRAEERLRLLELLTDYEQR